MNFKKNAVTIKNNIKNNNIQHKRAHILGSAPQTGVDSLSTTDGR